MFLEHPGGQIELRVNDSVLNQSLSREAQRTPANRLIIVGDHGWDPATLTLHCRLSSGTTATPGDAAWAAAEALAVAAKSATCLRELAPGARVTYLHGLAQLRRRPRGIWWELELVFLPRALDGTRGTGELITYLGAVVTHLGIPVSMELH